jgi:Holliday junction resolvase RusA-like endonuclease
MISITFHGNVPSKKNGRRWVQRGNRKFSVPSAAHEAWERDQLLRLKLELGQPKLSQYRLELWMHYPDNRRRDADNTLTSIQDVLVKAGVLDDDRWQSMIAQPLVHQPRIDRLNPRVEVVIHA